MMRTAGLHDIAVRCQRRAYARDPRALSIRQNLANILSDTGQNAEALDLRLALLADTPDDQQLKSMIGKSLRSLRREDEACALLEKLGLWRALAGDATPLSALQVIDTSGSDSIQVWVQDMLMQQMLVVLHHHLEYGTNVLKKSKRF